MESQITSLMIVYSTVYSCVNQRKHQSSASLAFVRGIYRWPVNSSHKGPVTRKVFPFDDVIMLRLVVLKPRYIIPHWQLAEQRAKKCGLVCTFRVHDTGNSHPDSRGSWGLHGAHLGQTRPRWAHVGSMILAILQLKINDFSTKEFAVRVLRWNHTQDNTFCRQNGTKSVSKIEHILSVIHYTI